METVITKQLKQKVFVANAVPDECIERAQVVIVSGLSWHIIAPNPFRAHGLGNAIPVPTVKCPVVDVRGVQDDAAMMKVMAACVDKSAGVINLDGLLTGLQALGAKVTQTQPKKAATAADVQALFMDRKNQRVARRVRGVKERVN